MQRDMDLIRRIAIAVRDLPVGGELRELEGVEQRLFTEHARLVISAGLVEGVHAPMLSEDDIFILERLTWSGHDFADAVANDTVWKSVKTSATKAGAWTFGILIELAKAELKQRLGLPA